MSSLVKKEDGEFSPRRFRPKGRTLEYHPSVFSFPLRGVDNRSEINYWAQLLSWEIANKYNYHLHENIQFIVDALNDSMQGYARYSIIGNSVRVPFFSVWTATRKYTFDLSQGEIPKLNFIETISELTDRQASYEH